MVVDMTVNPAAATSRMTSSGKKPSMFTDSPNQLVRWLTSPAANSGLSM